MLKQNSPLKKTVDLKSKRQRVLEISFICSLFLLCALFYSFKKFDNTKAIFIPVPDDEIEVVDIPITEHPEKINRPDTHKFPVESDDPGISDDLTIDYQDIDIGELIAGSTAPKGDEEEIFEFCSVAVKPKILSKVQPIYPKIARAAGTTGTVVIRVLIDKEGNIEKAEILKSVTMLDAAALDAAKRCKFTPAMQRDKKVKVWMAIPFKFMLN